ncbi:protein kinase domain-containing protein [Sorangium sp. So ce861]|uniref:protein kinase domain-containing protein n=1 Tax=Sorangium sp. So ce861 TaxID=3133323 RepID=UPI003F60AD24
MVAAKTLDAAGDPRATVAASGAASRPRSAGAAPAGARWQAGRVVEGRHELLRLLGRGGHGEVWEAHDRLTGEVVAVKLLHRGFGAEPSRVRREIALLRLLRLPGVVRLLDEGLDDGCPYLVMERVHGEPFPGAGAAPPCTWEAIGEPTLSALETLSRIHAAGVVHRDLKPANLLVDAAGRAIVLDFGLSVGALLGDDPAEAGKILGTPAYLAPEQIRGDPVSPRTDLYALGVLLYEALSGEPPHPLGDVHELIAARVSDRPAPLRERAPHVPAAVADVVDRLLMTDADARPPSAAAVMQLLRGQPFARLAEPVLPRLGDDAPRRRLIEAARARRAADLTGPPGSGRSRCLREVADALEREGRRVLWLAPAERPFGSLEPLLGEGLLAASASLRLEELVASVDQRVSAALAEGAVVIADDADRLDRWSAAALDRCRPAGAVLRAVPLARAGAQGHPGAAHLAALDAAALRPLFLRRSRFLHLEDDAARALFARTEGLPARVAGEVSAWVRAGLARWHGAALVVDRDALDRLDAGLVVAREVHARRAGDRAAPLPPHLEELLGWIALAWPHHRPPVLAAAMEQPAWRIEAEIEDLALAGAARRLPDGRVEPLAAPDAARSPAWLRRAHRAIAEALGPGEDARLFHLLASCEDEPLAGPGASELAREAALLARRRAAEGQLGQAVAALREGLLALRRHAGAAGAAAEPEAVALFALWVEIALAEGTPSALDRVVYELSRAAPLPAALGQLEGLAQAALAFAAGSERALAMAEAVAPFADPALERRRQGLRVLAARCAVSDRLHAVVDEVTRWAAGAGDPAAQAALAGWLGRLRYQEGRYEEAAALHAEAAQGEPWLAARIAEMNYAAGARMEAFRHEDAIALAREARELAARCRHAHGEVTAAWIERTAAYRAGGAPEPDPAFVGEVAEVGVPELEGLVSMTEAAVAFRADRLELAAELAERARRIWTAMGKRWAAALARSLAIRCGRDAAPGEAEALAEQAVACPVPDIGLQILGLLGARFPEVRAGRASAAGQLGGSVPRGCWHLRLDVLSVDEALAAIRCSEAAA